ncbi:hypothetical protein [Saccharibacillus sacchari]|uniref:Uncharacterized protein n=1 Tax=Saccharibacillus sacchari TaxID=456493 RepID=A0ACC6PIS5_9BACL
MATQAAKIIRETLVLQGFEHKGKWPRWYLQRQIDGFVEKVELLTEATQKDGHRSRRMNINFAVRRPRSEVDLWMNRPYEEWFDYDCEETLRAELHRCMSRIESEVLPWMNRIREGQQ